MKWHDSLEAIYALLFAVCILIALVLLAGCAGSAVSVAASDPVSTHSFPRLAQARRPAKFSSGSDGIFASLWPETAASRIL